MSSRQIVWWRCVKHAEHEWLRSICCRTHRDRGCPQCQKEKVPAGRSLADRFPALAAQWHPTKNGDRTPAAIHYSSMERVWWKCDAAEDHEWEGRVNSRKNGEHGCPFCTGRRPSAARNLWVCHPALAAEWHPTRNGSLTPRLVVPGSNRKVWWRCVKDPGHEWEAPVSPRVSDGRGCPFCAGKRPTEEENLARLYPAIAAEWHPTKNGSLRPEDLRPGSGVSVWWKCPSGADHEWQASVGQRTSGGHGCPFCAGNKLSITNCLAAVRPDLAREWHPTKNGALAPEAIHPSSDRRVWWRCANARGHAWQARVVERVSGYGECPFCAGHRASKRTCLATTHPRIAAEWHPERNGSLTPEDVRPDSTRAVWWRCAADPAHEWCSRVRCRAWLGEICPSCADEKQQRLGRKRGGGIGGAGPDGAVGVSAARARSLRLGGTSLAVRYPTLASEWHPTRNGALSPWDVSEASAKRVWWRCPKWPDHEWQISVANRSRLGLGCPFCSGRRVSLTNSLQELRPDLAAEWHPRLNQPRTPKDVSVRARTVVWWQCTQHAAHVWQVSVRARVRGKGCPECRRAREMAKRSLAARHPSLAQEWHVMRNGSLHPDQVKPASRCKVWWKCARGHIYYASVFDRARVGVGCPTCALLDGQHQVRPKAGPPLDPE